MESLDDDIIRFLNETAIANDCLVWDGEVIEIQDSDLDFIHSQCSSGPNSQRKMSLHDSYHEKSLRNLILYE